MSSVIPDRPAPNAPFSVPARPHARAVVDLDAIAHNTRILVRHAAGSAVMVVVKADGYNHGAVDVARTALAHGASEIGVTTVDEALALREGGIDAPVLAWLHHPDTDFAAAIVANVELGLSSPAQAEAAAAAAREVGAVAVVSLKIDTGLNRNGVAPDEIGATLDVVKDAVVEGVLDVKGIFSHLACADDPSHPATDEQIGRFEDVLRRAAAVGIEPRVRHLANSAALFTRPDAHYDMVRPGIALYGLSPVPDIGDFGLRPAMTLTASVAHVKRVAAGEGVSYGHEWHAPADTTVALLPVGYADGLPRSLGGRFAVSIGGVRRRAVGRVCMDQVVVDLGPGVTDVEVGDDAVFFGPGDHGEVNAGEWAATLGTIHYEIVSGVRGRVQRTTIGGNG